jgi:hypothetical protein
MASAPTEDCRMLQWRAFLYRHANSCPGHFLLLPFRLHVSPAVVTVRLSSESGVAPSHWR